MSLIYTRLANELDIHQILPIIDQAKAFLKASGSSQWQGNYPNQMTIQDDIDHQVGYVLLVDNKIAGYAAVITGLEPTYRDIEGSWNNEVDEYATIHRMAISSEFRGMHLANYFFSNILSLKIAQGAYNFRIDTSRKNKIMQHLAETHGFIERGIIQVDEDPQDPSRIAYELNL
ncbi:GNAT family N-acetyltransferase [uncultured Lactobacillus sp.]|uniref:GNAT family N-acetyltransferase n=1 Tax=uncultured Lactobacillus sp. TaxID=153152 RepID=UPI00260AE131|nr:GNAT family N-acetyltransferase [uncultured Lactobacillus sp.]